MIRSNIKILPDPERLAQVAVKHFVEIVEEAVQKRGICSVVLSGGSTPLALYKLLASEPFSEQVDWSRVHFFWGDERCVPPDHPESNYFKARRALIDQVPLSPDNIHRMQGELKPEQAAEDYEETLLRFFTGLLGEDERAHASFDLVLLGMGDDGHTASLFPGVAAIHEETRWVAAHYVDKLAAWRISLTPAILNRANQVLFMVAGSGKSWALQKVIYGSYQPERYPAQVIKPEQGKLLWLVDEAAATLF